MPRSFHRPALPATLLNLECQGLSTKEIIEEYKEYCRGIDEAPLLLDSGDFATVLETWQNQHSRIPGRQNSTGASRNTKVQVLMSYFLLHQEIERSHPTYPRGHSFHNIRCKCRMANVVLSHVGVSFWSRVTSPTVNALYQDSKTIREIEFRVKIHEIANEYNINATILNDHSKLLQCLRGVLWVFWI